MRDAGASSEEVVARGCDGDGGHRRESVVPTGEASSLARQCDEPIAVVALTCEAGGLSPRPNHVLTHVVTPGILLSAVVIPSVSTQPLPGRILEPRPPGMDAYHK